MSFVLSLSTALKATVLAHRDVSPFQTDSSSAQNLNTSSESLTTFFSMQIYKSTARVSFRKGGEDLLTSSLELNCKYILVVGRSIHER